MISVENTKVKKFEDEWKKILTPDEFKVLRKKGRSLLLAGNMYIRLMKKGRMFVLAVGICYVLRYGD